MEQQGPHHPTRLADALVAASRRRSVGRSNELAVFEALLGRSEPVGVLWLSGQGGVGKTALMQAWAGHAQQSGWRTVRLDGRTAPLSPRASLRRDRCSRRTWGRLFIREFGLPITSIRNGGGVRTADHDRSGSSRPVLSLRRTLPATTRLSLDPSCQNLKGL